MCYELLEWNLALPEKKKYCPYTNGEKMTVTSLMSNKSAKLWVKQDWIYTNTVLLTSSRMCGGFKAMMRSHDCVLASHWAVLCYRAAWLVSVESHDKWGSRIPLELELLSVCWSRVWFWYKWRTMSSYVLIVHAQYLNDSTVWAIV